MSGHEQEAHAPLEGHVPFTPEADDETIARERAKARQLRSSAWWKQKRGKGRCHYCGRAFPPKDLTMDHLIPLVRGGRSTKANLVPACKDCNSRKKHLLPFEWDEYVQTLADE
jgi:5-methylcytosine-specific restriction endonuclease McrA